MGIFLWTSQLSGDILTSYDNHAGRSRYVHLRAGFEGKTHVMFSVPSLGVLFIKAIERLTAYRTPFPSLTSTGLPD